MQNIDFYTNVQRFGNSILVRGVRDGKDVRFRYSYQPTLYIETKEKYGFKNIYGQNLKPLNFDSISKLKEFTEQDAANLKLYGFPNYHSQFILENYSDSVDKFDKSRIRISNIDIEVTSNEGFPEPDQAEYPITAMCMYDSVNDIFFTLGIGEWEEHESFLSKDILEKVKYISCENEIDLITKFLQYWTTFTPNIVTGWNVEGFDMVYIIRRLEKLGFDVNKLSPWGKTSVRYVNTVRGQQPIPSIMGVDILDYMLLYKKNKVQEAYRLDYISQVELGERKSLGTKEMLDMSRVPFFDKPSNDIYSFDTDDMEFNRFAKIRWERVNTQNSDNPNKDMELIVLHREEKKAAFQAFISYNIQDVNLVKRLDEKLGLLDAQIMIAYEACMNYEEVNSPVRTWDCLINKEMWKNNEIPHFSIDKDQSYGASIPGGFVKEPQIGKHGWCVSFDLNSLYPHLIMQYNISPETLNVNEKMWPMDTDQSRLQRFLDGEPLQFDPGNQSVSASGYLFSNDHEGIIPRLMSKMYNDRKKFKKEMIAKQKRGEDATLEHLKQLVMKLLLNSGYGALINKYFRWFDPRMGKSITLSGQYVIQVAEREINKWMNKVLGTNNVDYIIAIDTDSNYVNFQPLVDKFFSDKSREELVDIVNKIADEQVQKVLDEGFKEAHKYQNSKAQKMVMEREAIASSAFWTAKKRYAMCVWDMEGVRMPADKPKIKIQGLEAIRSSTPYICREPLVAMINKALLETEDDLQKYIAEFRKEFMNMPVEDIAMPRTMNNMSKYEDGDGFVKGAPPHTRGAIQFNRTLKKHGLENTYEMIREGEKGKFVYLNVPNNIGTDALSFTTTIPEEFDCNKYIDKNKMFEKVIIEPMMNILKPLGWSHEKKLTLESFFG